MIEEIIEEYFYKKEGIKVWDWLGIAQTNWSIQKKNGLSKPTQEKLKEYFNINDLGKESAQTIIKRFYKV